MFTTSIIMDALALNQEDLACFYRHKVFCVATTWLGRWGTTTQLQTLSFVPSYAPEVKALKSYLEDLLMEKATKYLQVNCYFRAIANLYMKNDWWDLYMNLTIYEPENQSVISKLTLINQRCLLTVPK